MAKKLNLQQIQNAVFNEASTQSPEEKNHSESPDYLERRIEAQSDVVMGKKERRVLYKIDPNTCLIRADHDRVYANLNEENCKDLIEGIKAHGQQIPAIVRPLDDGSNYKYELVSGARRHYVSTYLGKDLTIEIRELSEEEVFLLSDEENRNRVDISDYERALKYKRALIEHYKDQTQMAIRMGTTNSWLSRYLVLADLHKDIVLAYRDISEIKERHAREIKSLMKNSATANAILNAAQKMHDKPQSGVTVIKMIKDAAKQKDIPKAKTVDEYKTSGNDIFMTVKKNSSTKKVYIEIDKSVGASLDDWIKSIRTIWKREK